jgi:hypothetical protein
MSAHTPYESVLLVACFLYYGAKWEYTFVIRKLKSGHAYFYGFLVAIGLTAVLQSVYITQVDDSWPYYTVSRRCIPTRVPFLPHSQSVAHPSPPAPQTLLYGAGAPALDFLFNDFPGTGVACLCTAQLVFCLRVYAVHSTNGALLPYRVLGIIILVGSTVHFGCAWLYYKHGNIHSTSTTTRLGRPNPSDQRQPEWSSSDSMQHKSQKDIVSLAM